MGVKKALIIIVFSSVVFCLSCSSDEIHIDGTVRLSDDPPSGHGDVLIYTDNKETYSYSDGYFRLSGEVYMGYGDELLIQLYKSGYIDTFRIITLPELEEDEDEDGWWDGDRIIDIGETMMRASR